MRLIPLLPLFGLALCGTSALAGGAQDAGLGLFDGRKSAEQAAQVWEAEGLTVAEACQLLDDLPRESATAGRRVFQLEDAYGRSTDVAISVPDEPDDQGRYGVMIALHGLSRDLRQVMGPAQQIVPPHTILIAPNAQKPPAGLEYEDLADAEQEMREQIRRQFPHWWVYRDGGFPLRVLDYLKRRYPIDSNRVLLFGYSMGSFGAWNVALRYPDRFAGLVLISGGVSRQEYLLGRDERTRALLPNLGLLPSFFAHNTEDPIVPISFDRWTAKTLERLDFPHVFHELNERGHGVVFKKWMFREMVEWIAARRRDPHPRRVEHHVFGDYHGASYWLRIDEATGDDPWVRGEVLADNRLRLTTRGVRRLTVFLDPALVDPAEQVTVEWNDAVVFEDTVEPSLRTVAETFARARDPELVFQHGVSLELADSR